MLKAKYYMIQVAGLARLDHENVGKLLGYCSESNPFTRMLVFDYASNGTLFEHLHCMLNLYCLLFILKLELHDVVILKSRNFLIKCRWRSMPILMDSTHENYYWDRPGFEVSSHRT